jgi:hypothetical protein
MTWRLLLLAAAAFPVAAPPTATQAAVLSQITFRTYRP